MADGYSLGWVQIVKATHPGENNPWKEADRQGWFPDVSKESKGKSPLYPSVDLGAKGAKPAPDVGFEDYPNRFYFQGDGTVEFELGLVCVKGNDVQVIGTLQWGFKITAKVGEDSGTLTPIHPKDWGAPTDNFLKTLSGFFDGKKETIDGDTTAKWTFSYDKDCKCFAPAPEPATLTLAAVGAVAVGCAWRRRKRTKAATRVS